MCLFLTGARVSLIGLTATAACQEIFCTVLWNSSDLLMAIVDDGKGSSGSRAAILFLSLGFGLSVRVYPIDVKRRTEVGHTCTIDVRACRWERCYG